jgi:hypothetical protein
MRIPISPMATLVGLLLAVVAYWLPGPVCAYLLYAIFREVAYG